MILNETNNYENKDCGKIVLTGSIGNLLNLYCPNGISTFNWNELTKNGGNEIPQLF